MSMTLGLDTAIEQRKIKISNLQLSSATSKCNFDRHTFDNWPINLGSNTQFNDSKIRDPSEIPNISHSSRESPRFTQF